jgi:hypothetical protein
MNNLHRKVAPFPIRPGLRSKRKHHGRSSATLPDGASLTHRGRAAPAFLPSAPATCGRIAAPGFRHRGMLTTPINPVPKPSKLLSTKFRCMLGSIDKRILWICH